jgi:2,5-diketo-D-gluconate reductase A
VHVPDIELNNGVLMPQLGFGVFQVPDDDAESAVRIALESGYRSIDTASLYGNEAGVGRAIASSGLSREELFVTTKLWNTDQGYERAFDAYTACLDRLELDYVDLYLIHWPKPTLDRYVETWRSLEKRYNDGRVRAIGVSNFQPAHLRRLLAETDIVPAVNQIELHPYFQQHELRRFDAEHRIVTEAWSPLGQGQVLDEPVIVDMATRYGKTAAQVVLRWHIQLGNVVIPKSVTPERIRQNIEVFDFELSDDDMAAFGDLETGVRIGADPDEASTRRGAAFASEGGRWVRRPTS